MILTLILKKHFFNASWSYKYFLTFSYFQRYLIWHQEVFSLNWRFEQNKQYFTIFILQYIMDSNWVVSLLSCSMAILFWKLKNANKILLCEVYLQYDEQKLFYICWTFYISFLGYIIFQYISLTWKKIPWFDYFHRINIFWLCTVLISQNWKQFW